MSIQLNLSRTRLVGVGLVYLIAAVKFIRHTNAKKFCISKNIAPSVINFRRGLCSSFLCFFHFPCKVIILTSLLSVNKYWILNIFKWKYLVNISFTCSFVLFECKFCNKIFTMIYLNDLFYVFIYFYSHRIFYFYPCWHTKSCCLRLAVLTTRPIPTAIQEELMWFSKFKEFSSHRAAIPHRQLYRT